MRLTGTWVGEYVYGADYETDEMVNKAVPFTMSLTESWLRNVAGYVRDDASRGGQPERGRIHGRRRGTDLVFMKLMPVHYVTFEGKLIELRDHYAQHGVELPEGMPPHRILYRGTVDQHGESVAGTWELQPWAIADDGESLGHGSGTWKARRTSYETCEV